MPRLPFLVMNSLQKHDRSVVESIDYLVGIDEAGRGCLAGPVVAAACVLSGHFFDSSEAMELSAAINDSKQLSSAARSEQFEVLQRLRNGGMLDFEVAAGSVEEIAKYNILGATRLAMRRAVEELAGRSGDLELPTCTSEEPLFQQHSPRAKIIVDGRPLKPFPYAHEGIVKGDGKSLAIAMASVAAKVTRDRKMKLLAETFPGYGFEVHKGYGTKTHRAALLAQGACPIHRGLFLRKILGVDS